MVRFASCCLPPIICLFVNHAIHGRGLTEGSNTQQQDYRHSWTPSTTNDHTGLFEASGGPAAMYNGTKANPRSALVSHQSVISAFCSEGHNYPLPPFPQLLCF